MRKALLLLACCLCLPAWGCLGLNSEVKPGEADYVFAPRPAVLAPEQEHGLVCFLREEAPMGGGVVYYVKEGEEILGPLASGSYFCRKVTPGKHTFEAKLAESAFALINVEAGESYYVVGSLEHDLLNEIPKLTEVTASAALPRIRELKYIRASTEEEKEAYRKKSEKAPYLDDILYREDIIYRDE